MTPWRWRSKQRCKSLLAAAAADLKVADGQQESIEVEKDVRLTLELTWANGPGQRWRTAPFTATGCLSPRDFRQPMFKALKSTRRSSTRILVVYFVPCMHSFGLMTPRLFTISKLPFFDWAMYMFIRA